MSVTDKGSTPTSGSAGKGVGMRCGVLAPLLKKADKPPQNPPGDLFCFVGVTDSFGFLVVPEAYTHRITSALMWSAI